jgi:hypothetical protein
MSGDGKGKVSGLPGDVREELCQRMYDGQKGPALAKWLRTLKCDGHPDKITPANLSEWKKRHFPDWLKNQKTMDQIRERAELSLRMAKAAGGSLPMSMVTRLAGQIDEQIDSLADDDIKKVTPLLNVILTGESLRLEALKVEQKDKQIAISREKLADTICKKFVEWYKDKRARDIMESNATNADKIAALKKRYYADVDAIEDRVQLPQ